VSLLAVVGLVVVGFAAGMLAGMFGVGGAVVSTPAIRALGASPIEAVGSTIPAILPAAISGAHRYAKAGLVDWRVAWTCGVAGTVMAVVGAKVSDVVDARWLMVVTAGLLMWSGIGSMRKGLRHGAEPAETAEPADDADDPVAQTAGSWRGSGWSSTVLIAAVGAAAGFVAGLLGIGGGVVMVPLFTNVLRLPVKVAVASSLVAVAIFSLPAMISHALLGHIDWTVALLLTAGTVPGARVGSRIALGTAERRMHLMLGVFFCIIAVFYGTRELTAIL
jgi:uncharacterized membrane protein YfcA